ncbi:hypothetical protein PYW07_006569 [Mythimna separata]|uniref:Uncharacterized protein n=1 Tax=Mythimna separata TaxID=271217 RepID=A0AAD7YVK6_MYTSE|nr:hypothetical protein PYW07_006569 [Mythimna separata]
MISLVIPAVFLWVSCLAEDYFYNPVNVTRTSLSGIAAYRSALTLDWLAAEDQRQRELASAFETEAVPPARSISTDCIGYARPASGKVARLMLELLKNLEGDEGTIVTDLITALVRTKLLVETSMLEAEPDLDSLVKTPAVMMGEPHTTFPRILAMSWMAVTDPVTTKKFGWCPITRVNKYLAVSKPIMIAKQMRALEPVIARARFIMEEFIQHVTPLNMYQRKQQPESATPPPKSISTTAVEPEIRTKPTRPTRTPNTIRAIHLALAQATTMVSRIETLATLPREETSAASRGPLCNLPHFLVATIVLVS